MSRQNRSLYAILGLLSFGERSGYDLKKEFEQRLQHFWAESVGQIYPTLHRLQEEKLVSSRRRTRPGRPERMVYRITKKGRRVLKEWLQVTPAREQIRHELLLKMFLGPEMGIETALDHVQNYEALQRTARKRYRQIEAELSAQPVSEETRMFWRVTLLSGQLVNEARLKWCRETARILQEHAPARTRAGKSA